MELKFKERKREREKERKREREKEREKEKEKEKERKEGRKEGKKPGDFLYQSPKNLLENQSKNKREIINNKQINK